MRTAVCFGIALWFLPTLLAAPVPADTEKPKPRATLLGTAQLDQRVEAVLWAPDGKHLILRTEGGKALVVRRDQFGDDEPTVKPAAELTLPKGATHLDLAADGAALYSVVPAKRFNADSRLLVWDLKRLLEAKEPPKPDRSVALETDVYGGAALSGDGKHLLALALEPRRATPGNDPNNPFGRSPQTEYTARFFRVSAKTGDVAGDVAVFDDPQMKYTAHATDAKTGRLFVSLHAAEETVIRCLDSTTGKQLWERKLTQPPGPNASGSLVVSPSGGLVGVVQAVLVSVPVGQLGGGPGGNPFGGQGGGRGGARFGGPGGGGQMSYSQRSIPVLLDAKTGETAVELPSDDVQSVGLFGFSADGRLLAGMAANSGQASRMVVWDTKSGKVLKVWNRRGDFHAVFAPTGYEMLVREVESTPVYGPQVAVPQGYGQGGQSWTTTREVIRTDHKTILGVWDLAPLVR